MYYAIKDKAYGVTKEQIVEVINKFQEYLVKKKLTTKQTICPIIAEKPCKRFLADLVDLQYYHEENDDYNWVLVIVDSFSKFAFTFSHKVKSAICIRNYIRTIFRMFGAPIILYTDNGKEFVKTLVAGLCEEYNVKHVRGRDQCPLIQRQVEQLNQTSKNKLSLTLKSCGLGWRWIDLLEELTSVYIQLKHETIKDISFDLFFGEKLWKSISKDRLDNLYENLPEEAKGVDLFI